MNARLTLLIGLSFPACGPEPSTEPKTTVEAPAPDVDTAVPVVEPEPPCQLYRWYADADADGHGDPYAMVEACAQPSGYVDNYTDCDDADADAHPGSIWYADGDGDGFGDPDTELARCQRPLAHVTNADDCDDTDGTRNLDSVWYADADADGYGNPDITVPSCDTTGAEVPDGTDCDDEEASIHPARVEICDYIDNNCNGLVDDDDAEVDIYTQLMYYRDDDGDDYGTTEELGMFCESSDPGAVFDTDCDDTTALVTRAASSCPTRPTRIVTGSRPTTMSTRRPTESGPRGWAPPPFFARPRRATSTGMGWPRSSWRKAQTQPAR